jgi:hypothetical protein
VNDDPTNPILQPRPRHHRVLAGVCALVAAVSIGVAGGAFYEHQRTTACHEVVSGYRGALTLTAKVAAGQGSGESYNAMLLDRAMDKIAGNQDRCGLPAADRATG